MQGRRRWAWAVGLSFGVYAIPLVTAHWLAILGERLIQGFFSGRQPAWIALDSLFALALQGVLFALAWLLGRRGVGIAIAGCAFALIPMTWVANLAYMVTIPSVFLIETDEAPDRTPWAEACSVPGYSLDPSPAGTGRGVEQRGETVVRSNQGGYAILSVPGCRLERYQLPSLPIAPGVQRVLPDGSLVYVTMQRNVPGQRFWYLRRGQTEPVEIKAPGNVTRPESVPVVSDDGGWAAWQMYDVSRVASLSIQPIGAGTPFRFTHELLQRTTLVTVELDMIQREAVINRDLSTFARLRLAEGEPSIVWGPLRPAGVAAQTDTFRYLNGQWLGWDAYVEQDVAAKVVWSARGGVGDYRVPRGRSIASAALDPEGRYVAVSTSTSLNIGSFKDTVLVLRTSDGKPAFRKTLPRYARSQVAFLAGKYFAYSDFDGTTSTVRILHVAN